MASSVSCSCCNGHHCSSHMRINNCRSTFPKQIVFPPPLMGTNNLEISKVSSNRRPRITDDLDSDFQLVTSKKIQRKNRKSKDNLSQGSLSDNAAAIVSDPVVNQNNTKDRLDVDLNLNQVPSNSIQVTNESQRYALSCFPLPAFVIRFNSGAVSAAQVKSILTDHCSNSYQTSIQILHCRLAKRILNVDYYDCFIFVRDAFSFSFLLNESNWPKSFMNKHFSFQSNPSIPPQLCLLVRNVDLNIDYDQFCLEVKEKFPSIKNIIRMKNKFHNDITMVKLEFLSSSVRDEVLGAKRITVNYISYEVCEYLAPVHVLICSKCLAIGHFKKQCQQVKDTCRVCSELVDDLKSHKCSNVEKCLHCNQNHKSNSLKCPIIKNFRAELTRKVLHLNKEPAAISTNQPVSFLFNPSHFPPPPVSFSSSSLNNTIMNKLDSLISKLSDVQSQLSSLETKHDKFEQFIMTKNRSDKLLQDSVDKISSEHNTLKNTVSQINSSIDYHENIFLKLIFPLFDDICTFISKNKSPKNKLFDADMKCKIERYRLLINQAIEGKNLCIQ